MINRFKKNYYELTTKTKTGGRFKYDLIYILDLK